MVRLCGRLDGIPLAIELAAVQLRTVTLPQLSSRLEHRFGLLTSGQLSGFAASHVAGPATFQEV